MIELDQMKATLSAYKEPLKEVGDSLELEAKGRKIEELSGLLESPGFWDDVEKAQKMSRELNELKQIVEGYQKLQRQYEDIEALIEMGYEENDPEMIPE
ncbi:MAG: PCRF domain-containing protein, partial [Lachnospiraceae bacterium]|nr:PCRF domain-containing protein [Lachnospiraceae bacterium]